LLGVIADLHCLVPAEEIEALAVPTSAEARKRTPDRRR
jgi:hypothetical protein